MDIHTKYSVGTTVYIADNDYQKARIAHIKLAGKNLWYGVEYFLNGKLETLELDEVELVSESPDVRRVGI